MVGAKIGGFFNHRNLCFLCKYRCDLNLVLCIDSDQDLTLGFAKVNNQIRSYLMRHLFSLNSKKPKRSLLIISCLFVFSCSISVGYAAENKPRYELLLAGGGLQTCSSMAAENCTTKVFDSEMKTEDLYQISQENLKKLSQTQGYLTLSATDKLQINDVILNIYAKYPNEVVSRQGLRELFEKYRGLPLYRSLNDAAYYALLDSFEYRQMDAKGQRKREVTRLQHNKNTSSVKIYQAFVEQAALRMPKEQQVPHIVVITASSRDPFEVADFYVSVFSEAGAETTWLPLDKTYQQARALERNSEAGCAQLRQLRANNNSFYREDIYPNRTALQSQYCQQPEKMTAALIGAQGLFINGGDQSLTLAALLNPDGSDSIELHLIKQRIQAGQLIVGGTSAGTAVQAGGVFEQMPVPMITNGDPEHAMKRGAFANNPPSERCSNSGLCKQKLLSNDLSFRADGGIGLFELGLLDTHFSERDRETRLAIFAAETKQRFAFGVDETTALLVSSHNSTNKLQFAVLGQNGVFIVDRKFGYYFQGVAPGWTARQSIVTGMSHYLNDGSRAEFDRDTGKLSFSVAGEKTINATKLQEVGRGIWRNQVRKHCGANESIKWSLFDNDYELAVSDLTEFYYAPSTDHCSYTNVPFIITGAKTKL